MAVKTRHVLQQGPVLKMLASVALSAFTQRKSSTSTPQLPSEEILATVPPLPKDLIRDYIRHVGGDPSAYRGVVPPHLFPQWSFGLASKTLRDIPYPLMKVLNGGCKIEVRAPLPAGRPLKVRARLESIDDNGRRAVLHQRVVTGVEDEPNALIADLYAIVPLGGGKGSKPSSKSGPKKPRPRVPDGAEEIGRWRLPADAGLDFAKLTGDFNPVHWIPPYAKAFGFRNTILHGFSTMARAMEGVQRGIFAGSTKAIQTFDVQFTKPLVLPAKVGLYVSAGTEPGVHQVFVGDAPGGPAYLVGSMNSRPLPS